MITDGPSWCPNTCMKIPAWFLPLWITVGTLWEWAKYNLLSFLCVYFKGIIITPLDHFIHTTLVQPGFVWVTEQGYLNCIVRILQNILIWCICPAIVSVKCKKNSWTHATLGSPNIGHDSRWESLFTLTIWTLLVRKEAYQ